MSAATARKAIVDTTDFPRVRVHYTQVKDEADTRKMLEALREVRQRGLRYTVLMDARGAARPSPLQRRLIADQLGQDQVLMRRYCAAIAVVTNSTLIRGAITAIRWVKPPACPQREFSQLADAEDWLASML